METWTLRFTYPNEETLTAYIEWLKTLDLMFVLVGEVGDKEESRPHTHAILVINTNVRGMSKSTIAQKFLKIFSECKGNRYIAWKQLDQDRIPEFERYIAKDPKMIVIHNYIIDMELRKKQYWEKNKEIQNSPQKEPKRKVKALTFTESMCIDFHKENPGYVYGMEGKIQVLRYVIRRLGKAYKIFNNFKLVEFCNAVYNSAPRAQRLVFEDEKILEIYPQEAKYFLN